MLSQFADLSQWVSEAPASQKNFRQAIHCIIDAIAHDRRLREMLCMKGGILMALHYQSPRHTTDIDFSNPDSFTDEAETEVVERLRQALAEAPERLGYDLECRLQSHQPHPGRTKTYINLRMSIGYAVKGSKEHARLLRNNAPATINIDYTFRESIPDEEAVDIGDDGCLRIYGLPTLVAEKLRCLLQQPIRRRARRQDVYDLNYLLNCRPELESDEFRRKVLEDLYVKCEDRDVPAEADSMDNPAVRELAEDEYQTLASELPEGQLPDFDTSFDRVASYYRSLPWPNAES